MYSVLLSFLLVVADIDSHVKSQENGTGMSARSFVSWVVKEIAGEREPKA